MPDENQLRVALERFVGAFERDTDWDDPPELLWLAYEDAREVLGDPVKSYPGGDEGEHSHDYGWKPDDRCDICDDYADVLATVEKANAG